MWRRSLSLCYELSSISMSFYAVRTGRLPGIYQNWDLCKAQVDGFSGARYKKFKSVGEAQAFIDDKSEEQTATENTVPTRVYPLPQELFALGTKNLNRIENSNPLKQPPAKPIGNVHPAICKPIVVIGTNDAKRNGDTTDQPPTKRRKNQSQKNQSAASNSAGVKIGPIDVYTDGACVGNGKGSAKAAIGVYWGPDHHMNVSERLAGRQTNNRAEIHAARRAIQQAKEMGRHEVRLFTDSQFLINAITKWIKRWKKNNWTLISGEPVINREDFEQLETKMKGMKVHWIKVAGHAGIPGNERADQLANLGLKKQAV